MADQITVPFSITATNADILDGTQLDPIPFDGTLLIYLASTQGDSTFSLKLADELVQDARVVAQRTNGEPNESDDTGYSVDVINGIKARLAVTIVTAATVRGRVTLVPD